MTQYVALLRGINVGGKNIIQMAHLRTCFVDHGFLDAATYIQSGNVLFRSDGSNGAELTGLVEDILSRTFNYQATVVLRTLKQMRAVVEKAPTGFGTEPDTYRY